MVDKVNLIRIRNWILNEDIRVSNINIFDCCDIFVKLLARCSNGKFNAGPYKTYSSVKHLMSFLWHIRARSMRILIWQLALLHFVPVIFVDPNRGGVLCCIENVNYIIPFLFYYKHFFFYTKARKIFAMDARSRLPSLFHNFFFPCEAIFSIRGHVQKYFPTFHPRQLPLRKLTYSPLESFIPAVTSDIPHYLVPPVRKISFDRACPFKEAKKKKKKTSDKRIFNEDQANVSYVFFFFLSHSTFPSRFSLSLSRIPLLSFLLFRNEDAKESDVVYPS